MSKAKAQGTRLETAIVDRLLNAGYPAWRIVEGGIKDAGDIYLVIDAVDSLIIEAKAAQQINVTRTLAKAKQKAKNADLPWLPVGTVLWWKRLVPREGNTHRVADGEREVVVMDVDTFLALLGGK